MADLSQHRRTPAELEALTASAAQCGHTFATIESALPGFLARLAERKLKKAYGKSVPVWRPLTRRDDSTYFGRKRRARRARGRRSEARRNAAAHGLHAYALRGRPLLFSAGAALTSDRSKWTTLLYDEADSFPTGELTIEQWADARRTMQRQQGDARALYPVPYVSAFYVVPTEQDARAFFDPSLGEPWEEQADG